MAGVCAWITHGSSNWPTAIPWVTLHYMASIAIQEEIYYGVETRFSRQMQTTEMKISG